MTVRELIEKLKEYPGEYTVLCQDPESYFGDFSIESISVDEINEHILFEAV